MLQQLMKKWGDARTKEGRGESPSSSARSTGSGGSSNSGDATSEGEPGVRTPATTLMVRGIPAGCTLDALLAEWPMDGSWDFLYLPMRVGGRSARGFAFVNFVSEEAATAFAAHWQGRRPSHFTAAGSLTITYADIQGFDANLREVKQKPPHMWEARQSMPIFLHNGRRMSMEELL